LIVERPSTKNHNYNTMAAIAAPINAGLAGLPVNAYGLAGLPLAGAHGLALNAGFYANHGLVHHALPAQAPLVQGVPLQYVAEAPVLKAAPLIKAAPVLKAAPLVAKQYAVPPARIVEHAPAVETIHEKVEQHGYKIKY